MPNRQDLLAGFAATAATAIATPAAADAQARSFTFNIPAQSLDPALRAFARDTRTQVIFDGSKTAGKRSRALTGRHSLEQGLAILLGGSGMSFKRNAQGVIAISAAAVAPAEAVVSGEEDAGNAPAESESEEDIVVTAQLRSQRLKDVPMSIVALSADELEKRNVRTLQDVAREAPGLSIQDQGVGQRRIFMRGVGNVFGTSSLVGLYLDDASVTGIQDAEIDLRPYDLERVEVLRGPQGTLYGEGSTAGTIRFITNKPNLADLAASGEYRASFTKDGGMNNEFVGMVNVPIVSDTFGIRLSGMVQDMKGWIDQPAQGREDINDQQMVDLRMVALMRPTPDLSVTLTGILHRNDAGAQNTVENREGEFTQVLGQTTTPRSDDDYEFGNATITYDLGKVRILSSTTHLNIDKRQYNQGSKLNTSPPPSAPLEIYGDRLRDARVFSQEVRLSSTSGGLTWLLGGFYRQARTSLQLALDAGFGTPLFSIDGLTIQKTKAWSAFGNLSYVFGPEFEVGAGLRYFRDRRETDDGLTLQTGTFDAFSPRLYVRYSPSDAVSLYANVAKGFRSGGFNALGQPSYDPETAWTYEAGAKYDGRGTGINAELVVFQTDYKSVQILSITDPTTLASQFSNAGSARIRGVEANISAKIEGGWEVGASGSYAPSEFTRSLPNATHTVGDSLDFVPEYSANLWTGYSFSLGGANRGYARIDYSLQGRSEYRNRTVGDFFFSRSDKIDLLNASVAADIGSWRFELFASNLLNERGYVDATIIEGFVSQPRPRTFGISVAKLFGD